MVITNCLINRKYGSMRNLVQFIAPVKTTLLSLNTRLFGLSRWFRVSDSAEYRFINVHLSQESIDSFCRMVAMVLDFHSSEVPFDLTRIRMNRKFSEVSAVAEASWRNPQRNGRTRTRWKINVGWKSCTRWQLLTSIVVTDRFHFLFAEAKTDEK